MTIAQRIGQLARDQDISAKAQEFCHVARWLTVGKGQLANSINAAQSARATERIVEGIKASVGAGTTSDGTWAAPLNYQELSDAFLASLRNFGVFDAALVFAKDVPLNTQVVVVTTGVTAASIGEGQTKVISKLALAATALSPRKAVAIIAASAELLRVGGGRAARLFQQELQRAVAVETDAKFLSVISSGVSPVTGATGGGGPFAVTADMNTAIGGLTLGSDSRVIVAMSPSDAKHAALQVSNNGQRAFPQLTVNGGDYAGATIIPTDALSNQIVAFDATQIAAGSTGVELDASNQAAIQLDSAPDSPPTASTPQTSLWQNNLAGLRATRYFGCERLRLAAVTVTNTSWGTGNSPA